MNELRQRQCSKTESLKLSRWPPQVLRLESCYPVALSEFEELVHSGRKQLRVFGWQPRLEQPAELKGRLQCWPN